MRKAATDPLPLSGWTVLSLRPRGQHGSLRAASARAGARLLALSPLAIATLDDEGTRPALRAALAADRVLFTSPNAVRAASALTALRLRRGQRWLAVGAGTARALRRLGVDAQAPARMDSEGLLDLPELQALEGRTVGLVTAPGGRGVLAPALAARGARVLRAEVYARVPVALAPARRTALAEALRAPSRVLLALSSGEALDLLLPQVAGLPLAQVAVVAASARLAQRAREAGFRRVACADSARPAALLQAAVLAFGRRGQV